MAEPKIAGSDPGHDASPVGAGPATSSRARAPQALGKYRFIASLGHGGMAEVFLAVALGPAGFNKLQVIKRLRPNLAEDPELCDMFLDEARLAARLNHRNVVQTNEVDYIDGQYFMAMEYLDGQPLHRVLGRAKQLGEALPLGAIVRVVGESLNGLHYAHELADYDGTPLGIVHRDVSPQNIFVTYDGQVKIVDFGIAKAARRVVETQTGVIKGKVAYMAPEQAFSSSTETDRRADVFSVGVVLWEALAARRLWQSRGDPEIIASLLRAVPRLAEVKPDLPPELLRICDKALSLSRDDRHASAAELRADLESFARPCSAEELGKLVEGLFHEQRAEIKALLARQVDLVEQNSVDELLELDRGSLARKPRAPSPVPPGSLGRPRASLASVPSLPSVPSETASSETPPPSTLTTRRFVDPTPSGGTLQSAVFTQESNPGQRTRLLVAGLLFAGGAAGAWLLLASSHESPPAAAKAESAAAAAPRAPVPAPSADSSASVNASATTSGGAAGAFIQLHLAANPADARILLDGAALPSNPFDGKAARDGALHRVQVEANGFLPLTRIVVFDKDVSLDLSLSFKTRAADPAGMKPDPYK